MRISDWSSDVCSSDLDQVTAAGVAQAGYAAGAQDLLGARLGARLHLEGEAGLDLGLRAVLHEVALEGRQRQGGAQRGCGHRHRDRAVQVAAVAGEGLEIGRDTSELQ